MPAINSKPAPKKKQAPPIWVWSVRYSFPAQADHATAVALSGEFATLLKDLGADKFMFQAEDSFIEKTEEEKLECALKGFHPPLAFKYHNIHFQGYLKLKNKKRLASLVKLTNDTKFKGTHFAPCSDNGKAALRNYCMKHETRVPSGGPWADSPIYMGEDLITYDQMTDDQQKLHYELTEEKPDGRRVVWVFDPYGGVWKVGFYETHGISL